MARRHPFQSSPLDVEGVMSLLRTHLPALRERFHVDAIGVFGSFARHEQRDRSDLDVLVEFRRPPDLFGLMDLEAELRSLTGRRIDLVSRGALRGRVGRKVLDEVIWA
jgi:predicted nucleotidyltransferase